MLPFYGRSCVAAGLLLCILHVLSWIGMTYPFGMNVREEEVKFVLISYGILLSPGVAVFLLRRSCVFVALFSIPIMINFSVRMYYAWERFFIGPTADPQKGHWSAWLMTIMGVVSLGVIGIWLLARLGMLVAALLGGWRNKS
jgi:hypothetical protein